MMNKIYKHLLAASLLMMGGTAMAQTLNSAYFTDDYKFRHDMNPALRTSRTISPSQLWVISMSTCRATSATRILY